MPFFVPCELLTSSILHRDPRHLFAWSSLERFRHGSRLEQLLHERGLLAPLAKDLVNHSNNICSLEPSGRSQRLAQEAETRAETDRLSMRRVQFAARERQLELGGDIGVRNCSQTGQR